MTIINVVDDMFPLPGEVAYYIGPSSPQFTVGQRYFLIDTIYDVISHYEFKVKDDNNMIVWVQAVLFNYSD